MAKRSKKTENQYVEVKWSKIHGRGLFACKAIPEGTWIMPYEGERISKKEGDRRERFYNSIGFTMLFELENGSYIDGLIGGNDSVYANHSKKPNTEAYYYGKGVWFVARRKIRKGEEITIDYGFDP